MNVTKRNGSIEPLDIEKISKSIQWACEGVPKTSASDIEMAARLHFYDGIPTTEIHQVIINATKSLISLRLTGYSTVAAKLIMQGIYGEVYGSNTPKPFIDTLKRNIQNKHYTKHIYYDLSESEINELGSYIDYSRDFSFTHSGIEQLLDKYCIVDSGKLIEAPQDMFMAIAIDCFRDYPSSRLEYIKRMYDALSTFKISLPTPMMKALRTPSFDYASCCLISIGDSIDSWTAGVDAIIKHTTAGAGVGIDISSIASITDKVKQGKITHAGKVPVLKLLDAAVNSATQNGRRGSGTAYVNFFDPEIETVLAIKSPRTETNKRVQDLSYAIKCNRLLYDRIRTNGVISLFSSRVSSLLVDLFNSSNVEGFIALYKSLEDQGLYKSQVPAREFVKQFAQDAFEMGSHYLMNIDNANLNTTFKKPIRQANICMEAIMPTDYLDPAKPDSPDIAICILSNINQADVPLSDIPHYTDLLVRMLNNIIHRQDHPTSQANAFVRDYRALGIGFSNHAYWLATNGWRYGHQEAMNAHNEWMEHFQYYLLQASCNVASEFGPAPLFHESTYADGSMPYDRCNKAAQQLTPTTRSLDWSSLKADIAEYGLANVTLSFNPPAETSSVIGNMTSSLEPIKKLITIKDSKTTTLVQLAPFAYELADKYDIAYDRKINKDYIKHAAITQAWMCQGISTTLHYNPELNENGKVSLKDIISDWTYAHDLGLKTIYYTNTKSTDDDDQGPSCGSGGCSV